MICSSVCRFSITVFFWKTDLTLIRSELSTEGTSRLRFHRWMPLFDRVDRRKTDTSRQRLAYAVEFNKL